MAVNLLSVQITDADGDTNSAIIYLPTGLTLAEYQGASDQFCNLIDDVVDGQITASRMEFNFNLPVGLKAGPVAFSENQKGVQINFETAGQYSHGMRLPNAQASNFSGDTWNVGSDAEIDAFVAAMLDGVLVGVTQVIPVSKYGEDLTAVRTAVKAFRRK